MAISTNEIKEIAQNFFHESPEQRANQCGRMTSIMEMELEDHPNIHTPPTRQTGVITNGSDRVGHMFVTLPENEVSDVENGPVIVDVTIQQFCKDNYDSNRVELEVESIITIPEDVGIFTPDDDAFDLYEF